MRRILIDRARDNGRMKRGGHVQRIDLDKLEVATDARVEDLILLDEAISKLGEENKQFAELVKLRFFAGMSVEEAGAALGISARTARRHWTYSRA